MTRSSSGVTLLELLIVVMLMALIAAVTIPILGPGVSTTQLRSAAREAKSRGDFASRAARPLRSGPKRCS